MVHRVHVLLHAIARLPGQVTVDCAGIAQDCYSGCDSAAALAEPMRTKEMPPSIMLCGICQPCIALMLIKYHYFCISERTKSISG